MGLRCLLGHDFSEPEVEREREEDGSEVVTTVREVKTCDRCGETQIVSENTEVTTLDQLTDQAAVEAVTDHEGGSTDPDTADVAIDDGTAPTADSGADAPEAAETTAADAIPDADGAVTVTASETADAPPTATAPADGDDGAEILDAGPAETESTDVTETEPTDAAEIGSESIDDEASTSGDPSAVSAPDDGLVAEDETAAEDGLAADDGIAEDDAQVVEDDSEILDETTDAGPDRDHGAWPDMDKPTSEPGEPTPWPDQAAEDEGYDAQINDAGGESGVQFGGGLTPEADPTAPEANPDTEYIEAPSADAPAGHFDTSTSGDDDDPSARGAVDTVDTGIQHAPETEHVVLDDRGETEYYCPSCEMAREADGSSLRSGDICPECKRGYVDERPI